MKQDLIEKNKVFRSLLQKQSLILLLLFGFILLIPLAGNFLHQNPLLMGSESYYFLTHQPWSGVFSAVPGPVLFSLPLLSGIGSLLLFSFIMRRWLPPKYHFFFFLFLVLTPAFIYSSSTLSGSSWFFFWALAGFALLAAPRPWRYGSFIPFALATATDLASGIFLVLMQVLYFYRHAKEKIVIGVLAVTLLSAMGFFFFLDLPLALGPFQAPRQVLDLVSDLGALRGIGFIIILLSFIGMGVLWGKKEFRMVYVLLLLTIVMFIFRSETVLFLAVAVVFLAACGFIALFEQPWNLSLLKKFTFLLIMLGILFSLLTYLGRASDIGPTQGDKEALHWIQANTPPGAVVFSAAENSYFIRYFAQREPFQEFHTSEEKADLAGTILNSTYIATTFPLLEEYNITYVYITPSMKKQLSTDQGLLFILSNERFKLVYSEEGYEVWEFKPSGEAS